MGDIDVDPGLIGDHTTHWPECWRYHHECSTAEISRLRSVVAGVEALANKHYSLSLIVRPAVAMVTHRQVAQELRSVLSDTRQEQQT